MSIKYEAVIAQLKSAGMSVNRDENNSFKLNIYLSAMGRPNYAGFAVLDTNELLIRVVAKKNGSLWRLALEWPIQLIDLNAADPPISASFFLGSM